MEARPPVGHLMRETLEILYEDEAFGFINKPAGIVVQRRSDPMRDRDLRTDAERHAPEHGRHHEEVEHVDARGEHGSPDIVLRKTVAPRPAHAKPVVSLLSGNGEVVMAAAGSAQPQQRPGQHAGVFR